MSVWQDFDLVGKERVGNRACFSSYGAAGREDCALFLTSPPAPSIWPAVCRAASRASRSSRPPALPSPSRSRAVSAQKRGAGGLRGGPGFSGQPAERLDRERELPRGRRTVPPRRSRQPGSCDGPADPLALDPVGIVDARSVHREATRAVDQFLASEERSRPQAESGSGAESSLDPGPGDAVVLGLLVKVPAADRVKVERE